MILQSFLTNRTGPDRMARDFASRLVADVMRISDGQRLAGKQLLGRLSERETVPGILLLGDESYLARLLPCEDSDAYVLGESAIGNYAIFADD